MASVKRPYAMMADEPGHHLARSYPDRPTASKHSTAVNFAPRISRRTARKQSFELDASILMVGIRASGKNTLAIMAASALNKKIINTELVFQRTTGMSGQEYSKTHGAEQYQKTQGGLLETTLQSNPHGSIIVCSWMERRVQRIIAQFARTNPVIHVMRNQDFIQDCLRLSPETKFVEFYRASIAFFRSCANVEFFNVSEAVTLDPDEEGKRSSPPGSLNPLALKQTEQHLLKFLSRIYPPCTIPFFDSAYPLACILTDQRKYTHALCVSLDDILDGQIDIEDCSAGADACEIVVDDSSAEIDPADYPGLYTRISNRLTKVISMVRRASVLPIIIHIRISNHDIHTRTNDFYIDLLYYAFTLVPDMLTVDLRTNDEAIAQLGKLHRNTRLIGHCEMASDGFSWSHPDWTDQYQRAVRLGCDMVRFIRPAGSLQDNFEVAQLRSAVELLPQPHIPLIAYNSGPLGRHSAYMNSTLTPIAPPQTSDGSSLKQPPQLTSQQATRALYASFLSDVMKLYVFGANVGYSLSPAMHNAALEACGVPHRYEPFSTSSIDQVKHLVQDANFGGASIGLPFKVECIALADSLSPHAQAIGAINTLVPVRKLNDDGSVPLRAAFFQQINQSGPVKALYGENTDWVGIRACIRRGLSPANAVRRTTCALVVGAGGMARAAIYALLQVGVGNITIHNRTLENANKLASHFEALLLKDQFQHLGAGKNTKFEVIQKLSESWPSQFRVPSIIISCIPTHPIGDVPSPEFKLPTSWLANQTGGVIVELGYKTLNTPLLQQAIDNAHRGWVAMDGLDLLPSQGFAQFEFFTGKRAPRRVMIKAIFENYPHQHGRSNADELRRRLKMII